MNFFLAKLIFYKSNLCTDICKTIFVNLEVQFHHEGGLSGSRYLELFFSARPIFSPYQKSASTEAPFNLFWTLTVILTILAFWKNYEKNLAQNLGHYHLKKCKISCLGGLLKEKQESTFDLFSNFQKPYRPSCSHTSKKPEFVEIISPPIFWIFCQILDWERDFRRF